jgi:N-acetylneuraminic acid mutarotase
MKKLIVTVAFLCAASLKKYFIMVVIGLLGIVSIIKAQNSPWSAKCPLPERNTWLASCTLDGKIYVIGGAADLTVLSAVEVYNPVTDTWDTTKAEMSGGRWGLSANVVDGKIYAFGGVEGASGPALSKVEVYDPDSDTWELKTEMPTGRVGFASCVVDDKIYILGGAPGEPFQTPLKTVDVYDPKADSWNTLNTFLPTAIAYHSACVVDGKIYLIGGTSQSPWTGSAEIVEYDPANDKWTRKKDMPTGRWALTSCVENGKIYVIGGMRSPSSGGSSKVEEYDPATDTWKTKAEMPTRRTTLSASVAEGKIYTLGGATGGYPWIPSLTTVEEYDPTKDLTSAIDKVNLNKCFVIPESGSICITAKMNETTGVTLFAMIESPDQTFIDSLQLFNDGNHNDENAGDSIYANTWQVKLGEEQKYYVDLKVKKVNVETIIHRMNNMALFTTIGPVTYENHAFESTPIPGETVKLELTLINEGLITTASGVKAKIISLDTLAAVTTDYYYPFYDIPAGESKTKSSYKIEISESCPENAEIKFALDITSEGYSFWSDTFSIVVGFPTVIDRKDNITQQFSLNQNYPNPFNSETTIEYNISKSGNVNLSIYNLLGERIKVLINDFQYYGSYEIQWNGKDDSGNSLPKGIYILELSLNDYKKSKNMILIK